MSLLIRMLLKRKGMITLTVCVSVFSIVINLVWNAQLSDIIDMITDGGYVPLRTVIYAALTILLSAVSTYCLGMCSNRSCETLAHDLRMGYARYFTAMSAEEAENINVGEYVSKLQNEINEVSGFLRGNLFSVVDDIIKFSATFLWLMTINPQLIILSNLPVVLLMLYTAYSSKLIGEVAQLSQDANAEINSITDSLITTFPIIRIFNALPLILGKYNAALCKWETAKIREEQRRAKLMSLSAIFSCTPLILLFIVGGLQIFRGEMTIGTLYIFFNLSGNVSGVMMNMPGRIAGFRRFSVNMDRMYSVVLLTKGNYLEA